MDELHRFDAEVADDAVKRELAVDSQDGDGEGSCFSGRSSGKGSGVPFFDTIAKRRRRRTFMAHTIEFTDGPPKDEASDSGAGLVDAKVDLDDSKKPCPGCSRLRSGKCWFKPEGEVIWQFPNKRGIWCRDCYTAWRTLFKATHSLALFAKWLRVAENFSIWEFNLIAFLSFIAEGRDKITIDMVAARIDVLKFLSKFPNFTIEPKVMQIAGASLPNQAWGSLSAKNRQGGISSERRTAPGTLMHELPEGVATTSR